MWKPFALFLGLVTSAAASSNTVVISSFSNGNIKWEDTYTTGFYHVEWASELPGSWTSTWSELNNLPATGGLMRASVPMFYRVVHGAPLPMFEDFESAGGWADHLPGDWTEDADTGIWTTGGYGSFLYARTDAPNAHSGVRYIGTETDIPAILQFPPVNNPDEISYWVKNAGGTGPGTKGIVTLEQGIPDGYGGYLWMAFHQTPLLFANYMKITASPLWRQTGQVPPVTRIRLRLEAYPGVTIYIDDVTVTPGGD